MHSSQFWCTLFNDFFSEEKRREISLVFQHSVSGCYNFLFFKIRQISVSRSWTLFPKFWWILPNARTTTFLEFITWQWQVCQGENKILEGIHKWHFLGKEIRALPGHGRIQSLDFDFSSEFLFSQLNKYETAPNFIQLSQNLTSDCLLISVLLPVFTSFCMVWS